MKNLYDYILEGIKTSPAFYNAENHQNLEEYLNSLQEPAKRLWESYRSTTVKVDYSESQFQAAYLIRYYPHYVQMTLEILRLSPELFNFPKQINACFFGAGPCPEVAGLAQFLTEHCHTTESLFVNVCDIVSDTWKPSRTLTKNFVLPHLWKGKISGKALKLDLCSTNDFEKISEVIEKSDIFVFQNCLNEISNTSTTKENINFLLNRAPLDSFIIIADFLQYDQNRQIVKDIEENVNKRMDYQIVGKSEGIEIASLFGPPNIPPIVTQNLLTREYGLIPRSTIKFLFLVIRKG